MEAEARLKNERSQLDEIAESHRMEVTQHNMLLQPGTCRMVPNQAEAGPEE
jgi:hypothetical protein